MEHHAAPTEEPDPTSQPRPGVAAGEMPTCRNSTSPIREVTSKAKGAAALVGNPRDKAGHWASLRDSFDGKNMQVADSVGLRDFEEDQVCSLLRSSENAILWHGHPARVQNHGLEGHATHAYE